VLSSLCAHTEQIGLIVGMIMHGDIINQMTFKPPLTCRYDFLRTEEYLLKLSGCVAEHWNRVR